MKLNDIQPNEDNSPLNLRGPSKKPKNRPKLKNSQHKLSKKTTPTQEVKDLHGKKDHYLYIHGKKFTPPKYLTNLVKVAGISFILILIVNVINIYFIGRSLENEITASAQEGYSYLIDAGKSATKIEFDNALNAFDKAIENLNAVENSLWFITSDNSLYSNDGQISGSVNNLLIGGKHFAEAGNLFLEALEEFNKIPLYLISRNAANPDAKAPSITDALNIGLEKTSLAVEEVNLATEKINAINLEILPPHIRARAIFAQEKANELSDTLNSIADHFPAMLKLLGDRYPHRYLVLFQNNQEPRPTGGFIGSYAIIDVDEGYIEKLEVYDSYDIDGSYAGIIEPPEEFLAFTSNWRFRDSNYWPDFPLSAQKARWFLQKQGGPSVDTVIAINQGLLTDLLEITGPVQVGDFGALNSQNYNLLLSFIIEGKIWGAEDPKHILKVFVPAFKDALLKEENIGPLTSKLYRAVQQQHITMYSSDEEIQAFFQTMGLAGDMHQLQENEDYFNLTRISIGGTKTEDFIEEKITHDTHIDEYGELTNTVTIQRKHLWEDSVYLDWKDILNSYGFTNIDDAVVYIMGSGIDKINARIYVPPGTELLETTDETLAIKSDPDLQKDYFFTTIETHPGETSTLTIKYKLPFTLNLNGGAVYKLIAEKQLGHPGSIFTKTISTDPQITNLGFFPTENATIDQTDTVKYATNLVYDRYFSVLLGR